MTKGHFKPAVSREEALEKFKQFCIDSKHLDIESKELLENTHWNEMSLGFFLALGLSVNDSYELSTEARYKHGYWTKK